MPHLLNSNPSKKHVILYYSHKRYGIISLLVLDVMLLTLEQFSPYHLMYFCQLCMVFSENLQKDSTAYVQVTCKFLHLQIFLYYVKSFPFQINLLHIWYCPVSTNGCFMWMKQLMVELSIPLLPHTRL